MAEEAAGRDLIVSAKTGSGKTVAFGMAMAQELLEADRASFSREPLALVIAPTRELAMQVSRELDWLYADAGARVVTCVGGMDPMKERRALAGGAHIVVGTPGRLRDHLERGALNLSSLRVAVARRGRRDARHGLPRRTRGNPRRDAAANGAPCSFRQPCRGRSSRSPGATRETPLRIETLGDKEGHQDIAYQAVAVSPTDIEHAVVNSAPPATKRRRRSCSAPRATPFAGSTQA